MGENVINLKSKALPFLGYFFNEPTKSSLIGEKLPNLVTLPVGQILEFVKSPTTYGLGDSTGLMKLFTIVIYGLIH